MKIAIVGSGISGLTAAHYLSPHHEVTLWESGDYLGGHTHTVDVEFDGEAATIDTGFIVYNDWTYPNFIRLLNELQVATQPTSMGFSVSCERTGLEYNGSSLNGLFAQRRNLLRPAFYGMLREILRFNREAVAAYEKLTDTDTVASFVANNRYAPEFVNQYLLPMGAAIWSCSPGTFEQFPMRSLVEFLRNHGLLNVWNKPVWRVIQGGSRTYVERIVSRFRGTIRRNSPIGSIRRTSAGVWLQPQSGEAEAFDEVILACHSDQALRLLADPAPVERELLAAIPYGENAVTLHVDHTVLPKSRRAWASWNYHRPAAPSTLATVTYNMNLLQGLSKRHVYCVTLNEDARIDPAKILRRFRYSHPIFTTARDAAQRRHAEVIRRDRTSFCGAYWGHGFHEDGVNSALAVCQAFGVNPATTGPSLATSVQTFSG